MSNSNENLQELFEEYQLLNQKLEESDVVLDSDDEAGIELEHYPANKFSDDFAKDDYQRLLELESIFENEYEMDLPDNINELDIPSYGAVSPSSRNK